METAGFSSSEKLILKYSKKNTPKKANVIFQSKKQDGMTVFTKKLHFFFYIWC